MAIVLYHFTNSEINIFTHSTPIQGYSQATGRGIYFTTDYNKGLMKYGNQATYVYEVLFHGENILNLGEYDSAYFDGRMIHSSSLVTDNFNRVMQGQQQIPDPDIVLEHLSPLAFEWLRANGYHGVYGMDCWGYACPEFCVIDESQIEIVRTVQLR